jgi:hypothetical protein
MVHFDGLGFSGDVRGGECDDHSSVDDTCLDTADRDSTNTNLVDILERKAEWLVGGTSWAAEVMTAAAVANVAVMKAAVVKAAVMKVAVKVRPCLHQSGPVVCDT